MTRLYIKSIFFAICIMFTSPILSNELLPLKERIEDIKIKALSSNGVLLPKFLDYLPQKISSLDENGNWLRDDIEIYISYLFVFHPNKRAAFIQMTNILDRIATDGHQSNDARQITLWIEENAANRCFDDQGFSDHDLEELKKYVLDNESKVRSYNEVISYRQNLDSSFVFIVRHNQERCDEIILENQITIQSM